MKEKVQKCLSLFNKKSRMYKYDVLGKERLSLSKIWNRETISLFPGDEILVGEYSGPRLPEGATSLPEGAVIRWAIYSIS